MTQIAVGTQIWNYQGVGSGERTPLLILHGWGRNGSEWMEMARDLAEQSGRKVYVLDLPGFGASSLPNVLNMSEYADLVVEFCKYLEIKQVVLIGHSLGGRLGILLAAKHPDLIEKLVLVDPAGIKPKSIKRVILKNLAMVFGWVPRAWRQKIVGGMMDSDYRNSPALQQLYRMVVREDLRTYLSQIKCQVVVVWGEHDPILPLSQTKIYQKLVNDCLVRVVWGADHDPHLSKYEQTKKIIEESI